MGQAAVGELQRRVPRSEVRVIDANKLHIVKNLSCYANGKRDCANPESGPYRCWAHHESMRDPAKYGGADQKPVIYDGLKWADTVVFCTSTRWGSHSALAQTIIERMDTLENRGASWGEPYPMEGKRLGVVVGGLHWKTGAVAHHPERQRSPDITPGQQRLELFAAIQRVAVDTEQDIAAQH
jgi:hypothetical protein